MRSVLGRRLPGALYAGIAAYCCLSLFIGPAGLLAQENLERGMGVMRDNLTLLEERNLALGTDLDALAGDADRARLEARSLGWLAPGETEVVIAGRQGVTRQSHDPGTVLRTGRSPALADREAKRIGLGATVLCLLAGLLRDAFSAGPRSQRVRRLQDASRV